MTNLMQTERRARLTTCARTKQSEGMEDSTPYQVILTSTRIPSLDASETRAATLRAPERISRSGRSLVLLFSEHAEREVAKVTPPARRDTGNSRMLAYPSAYLVPPLRR